MPFGFSNVQSTFMRGMNQALPPFIKKFVDVYFDDILIYTADNDAHLQHICEVLSVLRKENYTQLARSIHFSLIKWISKGM